MGNSTFFHCFQAYEKLKNNELKSILVRGGGLEPPHHFWRQDLNLVRLPISPSSQLQFLKVIQYFTVS